MTSEELTRLFEQYANDIYRFAYSITHHAADAEDICQTIFCRLAKGDITLEHCPTGRSGGYSGQNGTGCF